MIAMVLLGLPIHVSGTACPAGYKHKSTLTNLYCNTAATGPDPLSYPANSRRDCPDCCEKDVTKCGGLRGFVCPPGKEPGSSYAWKEIATTDATKNTDCCVAKTTCGTWASVCRAGYKMIAGVSAKIVAYGPHITCCTSDPLKCLSKHGSLSCASGKVNPLTFHPQNDEEFDLLESWKNTACTDTNKNTNCCWDMPTCASATCPAGYKMKTGVSATTCPTFFVSSCSAGSTCCEPDPLKCGGLTGISCAVTKYAESSSDTWKNTAATDSNKNTNCCAVKATCASTAYTCPAGYKKKTGVDSTTCVGAAATCAYGTTCCEMDKTKCGGLTGILCLTSSKYLESYWVSEAAQDTWKNKTATEATKSAACCTAKATCAAFQSDTFGSRGSPAGSISVPGPTPAPTSAPTLAPTPTPTPAPTATTTGTPWVYSSSSSGSGQSSASGCQQLKPGMFTSLALLAMFVAAWLK